MKSEVKFYVPFSCCRSAGLGFEELLFCAIWRRCSTIGKSVAKISQDDPNFQSHHMLGRDETLISIIDKFVGLVVHTKENVEMVFEFPSGKIYRRLEVILTRSCVQSTAKKIQSNAKRKLHGTTATVQSTAQSSCMVRSDYYFSSRQLAYGSYRYRFR